MMKSIAKRKKMLLHACCAPCLIFPYGEIKSDDGLDMSVFYFNPNIHPSMEYIKRLETLANYCAQNNIDLRIGSYDPVSYLQAVSGNENNRCAICYKIRLEETAKYAAQEGYDWFETTLTVSPYQNHDLIKTIGEEAGANYKVEFKYNDYRRGFGDGQRESKKLEMYRQTYCGCVYSENERYAKKLVRAEKNAINISCSEG